ncbi:hypothetical protein [Enterococcus sp. DIV0800]|uniref:hypothetical protein n=1 Tax=unclassified Enterococcus TaxID=2608891 RepID=UPI003D3005CA
MYFRNSIGEVYIRDFIVFMKRGDDFQSYKSANFLDLTYTFNEFVSHLMLAEEINYQKIFLKSKKNRPSTFL